MQAHLIHSDKRVDQVEGEDPFAGEFIYHFQSPVSCEALIEAPTPINLRQADAANRILLEVLNASTQQKFAQSGLDLETQQYLLAMDAKLELLLRWTGNLLNEKLSLPPVFEFGINAHGIKLFVTRNAQELSVNKYNLMKLYLSENYPEPLRLYTQLIRSESMPTQTAHILKIQFDQAETQEALEKYIFKCHRQQISSMKKQRHAEHVD